jgi:hypothetical protein
VFDGKGENGGKGGEVDEERRRKQKGRKEGDKCLCDVTTSRKSAWSEVG